MGAFATLYQFVDSLPERRRGLVKMVRFDSIRTNAEADGKLLEEVAGPDEAGRKLLAEAVDKMKLSARGYHRVLRVARTIADLSGAPNVVRVHIAEALSYRRISPQMMG